MSTRSPFSLTPLSLIALAARSHVAIGPLSLQIPLPTRTSPSRHAEWKTRSAARRVVHHSSLWMVVSMWLLNTRLRPWLVPGSVPITFGRSGRSATFFAANPSRVSQSYTYSPTGPSLPVGLSMLPRSRATFTSSSTSMRSSTACARASIFMTTPS